MKIEEQLFVISFAVTRQHKLVYLNHTVFTGDKEDKFVYDLENFCDNAVDLLQEKYKKRVKIIIYDSESLLSEIGFEYTRQQYYRINCFSQLIRRLKLEIKTWAILPIHLRKDLKSMANYYRALKKLNIHFIESKASLAEGVEKVLEFLGQNTTLNESVADIIIKSLKSAPLGANYLHPMYKGLLLCKFTNHFFSRFKEFHVRIAS